MMWCKVLIYIKKIFDDCKVFKELVLRLVFEIRMSRSIEPKIKEKNWLRLPESRFLHDSCLHYKIINPLIKYGTNIRRKVDGLKVLFIYNLQNLQLFKPRIKIVYVIQEKSSFSRKMPLIGCSVIK